ncbi:unnamed protein product [Schistosoma rodhaini]|uniref:Pentacotripeptide-repeat region of PRORP domain-containing protein n=1 Tax=Schistosoma rodhaini TaxID=6188 RepID=A0AA85EU39_9TREM|nr:unnamed protein product [Schistosoma rodhaini]
MIIGCSRICNLLKSSLYHYRIQPITACSLLLWRRSQSHYKASLSTRDLVEVINQKAKIHRYIKPQEPEESLYVNSLERCDSEQELNVISENDQFDFGALNADNLDPQPYHESLVTRSMYNIEKKSVIDELLSNDEPEEDPADCLRLSKIYRRHPPEHYLKLIKRYCRAGDTNSALSVFFSEMLEKDRVLPSRVHAHMVLDGLARVGDSENAFRVYKKMTELGIDATQATYSRLFRACAEDIATWFRRNRTLIPPVVIRTENHSSLLQRKMLALQKALAPDMSPDKFGGPALHKVYRFWRRLTEKNIPMNQFTYNALILALAKAGDIHGCLRALDMMLATENSERFSQGSVDCKNKWLVPDSFTITSVLSSIEPATMKRNLESCHRRMGSSEQSANSNDVFNRLSPFQLALSLWHDLVPLSNNDIAPHNFTLLARIMGLKNDCLDANNNCEIIFVNNSRYKSFEDIFKSSVDPSNSVNLIHPSCTSRELASMMIAQATQSPLLDSTCTTKLDSTSNEPVIYETPESPQFDWNNTMLALRSPINLLLPTDKPIVICGPKEQGLYPWQRLALVGGLYGLLDIIENHYKLKLDISFFTCIIRLLPPPVKSDQCYTNDALDTWETEVLNLLSRFKLTVDATLYNALIHRRTSAGLNANHLLADMTRNGLIPNQITWGCLARGCQTKESVKQLLRGFEVAATTPLSSSDLEANSISREQNVQSLIIRPSFTFFSTILSTSGFDWDLKAFVIEYMRRPVHVDELSDKNSTIPKRNVFGNEVSNHFDGFVLDRRVIASIDIDIGLFRELLVKGIIPMDGSPVQGSETGGFRVYPNAVRSFYRFYKIYKSWLRESPVEKPR